MSETADDQPQLKEPVQRPLKPILPPITGSTPAGGMAKVKSKKVKKKKARVATLAFFVCKQLRCDFGKSQWSAIQHPLVLQGILQRSRVDERNYSFVYPEHRGVIPMSPRIESYRDCPLPDLITIRV